MGKNSENIANWLKLAAAEKVGPVTFYKLLKRFGSPEQVLGASVAQLMRVEGIGPKTAEKIAAGVNSFDVEKELALAEKVGVCVINFEDSRYPPALKRIYDPPPVLYLRGELQRGDGLAVAIVGSRRCSLYGSEQASRLAHFLAAAGFTIVSGMARGIDTAAHRGALSANSRTIAVLGSGLARPYPPENNKLFEQIGGCGACVSELPLTYEPLAENFPSRNRIIAGLSLGVIVVEAGMNSGALITARAAADYDREVMAVPGKIDSPLSKGAHQLIKQGARLVESVDDVLEALGYIGEGLKEHTKAAAEQAQQQVEAPLFERAELSLSENEKGVYECLDSEPVHIEEIIASTELGVGAINAALISLRLKGLIRQLPGNSFRKA